MKLYCKVFLFLFIYFFSGAQYYDAVLGVQQRGPTELLHSTGLD